MSFASQGQVSRLPNGDRYIVNKIIVTNKYDASAYITGRSIDGIAATGITSIDKLCSEIGVISVEPFYPGYLKKPALRREVSRIYIFTLRDGLNARSFQDRLKREPHVEYADLYVIPELCYIPNDPDFGEQWFLPHIHADDCWNTVRGDTTSHVVIGIDDSGVYWDHPDLAANIWINAPEDINHNGVYDSGDINGIDDDGNGYVDDVIGWDFGNNDNNPIEDFPFHGTIVAGCASEVTDNAIGGAGIGFSARLMCVKATNSSGMMVGAYQALTYAADNGAQVINCSWGSSSSGGYPQGIIDALCEEGVLIVAAAGNGNGPDTLFPAGYEHVLAVTATDNTDHLSPGAGYGDWVDVAAPGVGIYSAWDHSSYIIGDGTSLASPIAAGMAALMKTWLPYYDCDQLDSLIRLSADSIGELNPDWPQAIRINAVNWLNLVGIDESLLPGNFTLAQNFPNPFNAQTTISYNLPKAADVTLDIFDILGRRVETLIKGHEMPGVHSISWDAKDFPSGIYFYKIKAGEFKGIRKCILLK